LKERLRRSSSKIDGKLSAVMNHIEMEHPKDVADRPMQCDPPVHPEQRLKIACGAFST
jgi:hypothetical protein